jgi:hypothetical protein
MTDNDSDETLERAVDRALRELPLRRAPHTLESRVFAELERRAWSDSSLRAVPRSRTVLSP